MRSRSIKAFGPEGPPAPDDLDASEDARPHPEHPRLLTLAAEIHDHVRSQVSPETWQAFWLVAVEDRSVLETAGILGKSYAATFAAQCRVRQRLRDRGWEVLQRLSEASLT